MAVNFQKSPTETIEQYNARVARERALESPGITKEELPKSTGGAPESTGYYYNPDTQKFHKYMDLSGGAGAGASSPVSRYGGTAVPTPGTSAPGGDMVSRYYADLPKEGPTPEQEEAIREQIRKRAQTEIDAINSVYAGLLEKEQLAGEERLGEQRALASRSGIMGQDFGIAQKEKVRELNSRMIGAIESERAMKLTAVLRGVDERATKQIEAEKLKAEGNMKDYMKHLEDTQSGAKTDIANLAKGGVKLSELSPDVYNRLKQQSGLDDFSIEALFNANKPKAEQVDYQYRVEGNKVFAYGIDPATGQLKTIEKDLGFEIPKDQEIKVIEGEIWSVDPKSGTAKKIGGPGKAVKETEEEKRQSDYQKGKKFVEDNPTASVQELEQNLRANTSLSEGDIKSLLKGKNKFLTKDYLKGLFTDKQLKDAAKEAGFTKGGFLGIGVGEAGVEEYLTSLEKTVEQYRTAGYSDEDILKLMK